MLGIWSGIGGVLQERLVYSRLKWRQRNVITEAKARLNEENDDSGEAEKKLAEINEAFDKQISDAMHKIRVSIGCVGYALSSCPVLNAVGPAIFATSSPVVAHRRT